jgi:hypothetical protein
MGKKIFFPASYLFPGHQATPYGKCSAPSSYQGQSHEIRATRQAMQATPLGSSSRTANEPPARKENSVYVMNVVIFHHLTLGCTHRVLTPPPSSKHVTAGRTSKLPPSSPLGLASDIAKPYQFRIKQSSRRCEIPL